LKPVAGDWTWQWVSATLVSDAAVDMIQAWYNNGKKSLEIGDEITAPSLTNYRVVNIFIAIWTDLIFCV
jgi:hypothetical protein